MAATLKPKKRARKKAKPSVRVGNVANLARSCRKTVLFNEREVSLIEQYCAKFRIRNKSAFIRDAVISHILQQMDENYPKLF
ncbi:MAG: hypothetical protein KBT00_04500 [Bacteroidales bacterium]|nr:hypothetical protein [Candidatus Cacconaster merdequi]